MAQLSSNQAQLHQISRELTTNQITEKNKTTNEIEKLKDIIKKMTED